MLFVNLYGANDYSLRIATGKATISDFSEIIVLNWKGHPKNLQVFDLDAGVKLYEDFKDFPIDIYFKTALSYYDEDSTRDNSIGLSTYIKAYWSIVALKRAVRFGFGEGVSYTSKILYTEYYEALQEQDTNSKFLNYLDVSLDCDIGKLFSWQSLEGTYVGWTLKHRSGIFGLINNVRRGGSNYNMFSIERTF